MGNAYAKEDQGDLNVFNISTSRSSNYKDIDLFFKAKGTSGDIFKKRMRSKTTIKTLLLTNRLENLLIMILVEMYKVDCLDLQLIVLRSEIKDQIMFSISKYEPRAEVLDLIVTLDPDRNALHVNVEFKVVNTGQIVEFSTIIERVR